MKKALNQDRRLVSIIESIQDDIYRCPVCNEVLTRKFGLDRQYFAHPKGKGDDCEIKMTAMEKEMDKIFSDKSKDILKNEYYEKKFDDINVELSDYLSEEGYYLTQEQKSIIFAEEDRIKIAALAGSAKSSTLYYYAKERPHKKTLYLVYNKAMKDEADHSFGKLPHVQVKTIHGLAYGYVGRFYQRKLTFNYGVVDIIKDLNLDWNRDMELASKINAMMKEYMLGDVETFEEMDFLDDNDKLKKSVIFNCERLWELKKNYKNDVKVEHDFYLKLFQLSKMDLSDKYDIVLLDEGQDSNMMMLDILKNSNIKGVIIVGDSFQQIYSWRKALNIMPHFNGREYRLTTSFRVSQNIANIANMIVKDICGSDINMKGFNDGQKIVEKIDRNSQHVCLCRTNSYIFAEVVDVITENKKAKLYFEGGYKGYKFENVKDAYYFSIGHEVKNSLFKKFKNYSQMIEYAEEVDDLEILALDRMIKEYGSRILNMVETIKRNSVKNKADADVLFSTIHKSKGQTFNMPVYISDDHFDIKKAYEDILDKKTDLDLNKLYEETCILYVAITRCAGEIQLSDTLKEYLLFRYNLKC